MKSETSFHAVELKMQKQPAIQSAALGRDENR